MNSSVLDVPCEEQTNRQSQNWRELGTKSPVVRTIRTLTELEELRETWNGWCDDPNADLDFYLASARCRPDIVRPHVMVVYRDGRPDCMMIGRLEYCRVKLKIGYTTLFEPKVKRLFFLQGGFLGNFSEENTQTLFRELKNCLEHKEADHAELARIIPNSVQQKAIEKEFSPLSTGHFSTLHEHRWVELPRTFEQFVQSMSRKNRHEFRRHEKRLAADFPGKARFRCYRHEGEVAELAREVEKISAKTYQRALGVGFLPGVEVLDYLRTMARKTGLRGCALYLDDQPCAFFIGVQYKDTLHGNFMGFDPQYGKYSPGLLVLMHSIERCFEPDCRASRVDFGWGDRHYKRAICNQSRQDGPMYLYPFSASGLKLNFLRSATSFLDLAARKSLEKHPSLQKLKRLWQGRLQNSSVPSPADREYAD